MDSQGKKNLFAYIISTLNLSPNAAYSLLDFGCGTGDFLGLISKDIGSDSLLLGIDSAEPSIKKASEKYPSINFLCKKFGDKLDLPDSSFDIIVTIDVIECISNRKALINEFHRILKPGGKVLAAHWDWDSMLYNAGNKVIIRKAISAFSEWKQPWMENCDSQMGRKLWGLFEASGKFRGKPDSFNLIETAYEPGKYGFDRMQDISKLIDKGGISKVEYATLHRELVEQNNTGTFFYCVTSFLYCGERLEAVA